MKQSHVDRFFTSISNTAFHLPWWVVLETTCQPRYTVPSKDSISTYMTYTHIWTAFATSNDTAIFSTLMIQPCLGRPHLHDYVLMGHLFASMIQPTLKYFSTFMTQSGVNSFPHPWYGVSGLLFHHHGTATSGTLISTSTGRLEDRFFNIFFSRLVTPFINRQASRTVLWPGRIYLGTEATPLYF